MFDGWVAGWINRWANGQMEWKVNKQITLAFLASCPPLASQAGMVASLLSRGSDTCSRLPCHSRIGSHSDAAHGLAAPAWLLKLSAFGRVCLFGGTESIWGWELGGSAYPSYFPQVRPECVQNCLESRAKLSFWLRPGPRATCAWFPPSLPFQSSQSGTWG